MNPVLIAQVAAIAAPIIKELVVEGGKLIMSLKDDVTQEQINQVLEASKSVSWPTLDFKQP